jgi:conjugative transfer region protein TrbK
MRGGCLLPLGCLGLLLAAAAAGSGIIATVDHAWHELQRESGCAILTLRSDALARALVRCQRMGEAAGDDARCQAAWAESRRRFLDYGPRPAVQPSPETVQ